MYTYAYKFLYMKLGGDRVAEDTGAMDADNEGEMDEGMNHAPEVPTPHTVKSLSLSCRCCRNHGSESAGLLPFTE